MATYSSTLAQKVPWMEKTGGLYSPWGHKELVTIDHFFLNLALYHMLICKNCQNRSCHDPFIESTSSLMCSYMCLSEYFYRIFKQRHLFILTENFNLVKSFLPFFFFFGTIPLTFPQMPRKDIFLLSSACTDRCILSPLANFLIYL